MPKFSLFAWPARSPDLSKCNFFLQEYVKGKVMFHHFRQMLLMRKIRTTAAVNNRLQHAMTRLGGILILT